MIRGLDTTFLVQVEVVAHPGHAAARARLRRILDADDTLGIAPQILFEFIHVVTDPRRFTAPLSVEQARGRAEQWWNAREVTHVLPTEESTRTALEWLRLHHLGRKRLLDTFLATTYYCRDIRSILSTNARDFAVFGCFDIIVT